MTFLSIASSKVRYSLIETGSLCDLSLRKKSISIGVALHSNEGGGMKHFAAALALAAVTGLAAAQSFPTRAVTLISPFPPGGSTDTTARIIAERMRAPLGQSVVVETVGGAGGSIGVGRVARAAPDGYTIDIGQWDTHVGNIIYPINYDLQKDFEPIEIGRASCRERGQTWVRD